MAKKRGRRHQDRVAAGEVEKKQQRQRKRLRGAASERGGRDLLDGTASAIQHLRGGLASRRVWVGRGDGIPWASWEVVLAYASGGGRFRWQLCELRYVRAVDWGKGEVRKAIWIESGRSVSTADRWRLSRDELCTLRCAERAQLAELAEPAAVEPAAAEPAAAESAAGAPPSLLG